MAGGASAQISATPSAFALPGAYRTVAFFDDASGTGPAAPLLLAKDGHLYGTTQYGGSGGGGTLFRMSATGKITVLHTFVQDGRDGFQPTAGVVQDRAGNLYGTTSLGGTGYAGTVYKLTPKGVYTVLHSFQGGVLDGFGASGALAFGADGNLYGAATAGCAYGQGCIFRITVTGTVTIVHSFSGPDGSIPQWGLIAARDGNFYGTTNLGGSNNSGTVFRLTPSGVLTTIHSFEPMRTGAIPSSALIQARDGNLYGTTNSGGASTGGTLFKVSADGVVTAVHSFVQGAPGGDTPVGLVQGSNGALYGTTANFGSDQLGTIFRLSPSGQLKTLHKFSPRSWLFHFDGAQPLAPPIALPGGILFGTTSHGGAYGASPGYGTVYRLFD